MLLAHLCDITWQYDLLHEVEQSPAGDGRVYGQGTGAVSGRLVGSAQWSNFPRLRDGFALPDARGVIHTDSGVVLFALTGLSSLVDGRGVHVMTFQTTASDHRWLNDVIAIGEGSIDVQQARLVMRYYECIVELPLPELADSNVDRVGAAPATEAGI